MEYPQHEPSGMQEDESMPPQWEADDFAESKPGFWGSKFTWVVILLQDYPLVIWGALLAMAMVAAGMAVNGLMNPTLSRREELPGIRAVPEVASALSEEEPVDRGEFPLWSLGALVLSCAGATLLMSRHLNWSKQREALLSPLSLEELAAIQSGSAIALADDPVSAIPYLPLDEDDEAFEEFEEDLDEGLEQPALNPAFEPTFLPAAPTTHALPAAQFPPIALPSPIVAQTPQPPSGPRPLPPATTPEVNLPLPPAWERTPLDHLAPGLAEVLEIQRRRSQKRMNGENRA